MSMTDPTVNETRHLEFLAANGFDDVVTLWFNADKGKPFEYTLSYSTTALGVPPGLMLSECVKGNASDAYIRPLRFSIRHTESKKRVINADLKEEDLKLVLSKLAPLTDWDMPYKELARVYNDPDCTLWPSIQRLEASLGWSFPCLT